MIYKNFQNSIYDYTFKAVQNCFIQQYQLNWRVRIYSFSLFLLAMYAPVLILGQEAGFSYSKSTFCNDAYSQVNANITGVSGGEFSISPSNGSVTVDPETGQLTILDGAPVGTYTISYDYEGPGTENYTLVGQLTELDFGDLASGFGSQVNEFYLADFKSENSAIYSITLNHDAKQAQTVEIYNVSKNKDIVSPHIALTPQITGIKNRIYMISSQDGSLGYIDIDQLSQNIVTFHEVATLKTPFWHSRITSTQATFDPSGNLYVMKGETVYKIDYDDLTNSYYDSFNKSLYPSVSMDAKFNNSSIYLKGGDMVFDDSNYIYLATHTNDPSVSHIYRGTIQGNEILCTEKYDQIPGQVTGLNKDQGGCLYFTYKTNKALVRLFGFNPQCQNQTSHSIQISVVANPVPLVLDYPDQCPQTTAILKPAPDGATGTIGELLVTPDQGLIINQSNGWIDFNASSPGQYIIKNLLDAGCGSVQMTIDTVNIYKPDFEMKQAIQVCPEKIFYDIEEFVASSEDGYVFTIHDNYENAIQNTNALPYFSAGNYFVRGTTDQGCFKVVPLSIGATNVIDPYFPSVDTALCLGQTFDLSTIPVHYQGTAVPPNKYVWINQSGDTLQNHIVESGIFKVRVQADGTSCTVTSSNEVVVTQVNNALPQITIDDFCGVSQITPTFQPTTGLIFDYKIYGGSYDNTASDGSSMPDTETGIIENITFNSPYFIRVRTEGQCADTLELQVVIKDLFSNTIADQSWAVDSNCLKEVSWSTPSLNCGTLSSLTHTFNGNTTALNISDQSAFLPTGLHTFKYIANKSTLQDTIEFTINIYDNTPPVITCLPDTTVFVGYALNDFTSTLFNTSTDNCQLDRVESSVLTGTVFNELGDHAVTYTAYDASGNHANCQRVYKVIPQDVNCIENKSYYLTGCDTALPLFIVDWLSENPNLPSSQIDSIVQSPAAGTVLPLGTHNVEITAYLKANIQLNCNFDIALLDTIAPILNLHPVTAYLSEHGTALVSHSALIRNASDNCTDSTQLAFNEPLNYHFTCEETGTHTIVITVTDLSGNSTSSSTTISVIDTISPSISCPDDITLPTETNFCYTSYTVPQIYGSDNCILHSEITHVYDGISSTVEEGNLLQLYTGIHTFKIVASDNSSNTDSCTYTVEVEDLQAPTLVCPDDTIITQPGTIPDYSLIAEYSDNCSPVVLEQSLTPFGSVYAASNYNTTTTETVYLRAVDAAMNYSLNTCAVHVILLDTAISCLDNDTLYLGPSCEVSMPDYIDEFIANNSELSEVPDFEESLEQSPVAGTSLSFGNHLVTIKGMLNQKSFECSFSLFVADTTPPVATAINDTVYLDATGNAWINTADLIQSLTDCNPTLIEQEVLTFNCEDLGEHSLVISVEDAAGNSSTVNTQVTVLDTLSPILPVSAQQTLYVSETECTVDYKVASKNFIDNCYGQLSVQWNSATGNSQTVILKEILSLPIGVHTFDYSYTAPNGQVYVVTDTIAVTDAIAPTVTCVDTLWMWAWNPVPNLSDSIQYSDNCEIESYQQQPVVGQFLSDGVYNYSFEATDMAQNSTRCGGVIMVIDTIANCLANQFVNLTDSCSYTLPDFSGQFIANNPIWQSTDDFESSIEQLPAVGTHLGIGEHTITLKANVNGQEVSCSFTITIEESIAPIINCTSLSLYLDENGTASIDSLFITGLISDGCSDNGLSFEVSEWEFNCGHIGINYITIDAWDGFDNHNQCEMEVTVLDTMKPEIQAHNNMVIPTDDAECGALHSHALYNATDNCLVDSIGYSIEVEDTIYSGIDQWENLYLPTGIHTVKTWAFSHELVSDTASFTIEVYDAQAPTISVVVDSVFYTLPESCEADVFLGLPTIEENCKYTYYNSITGDTSTHALLPVGHYEVIWYVTDNSGLSSTVEAEFSVIDTIPYVIQCSEDLVFEANLNCEANVDWMSPIIDNYCSTGEYFTITDLSDGAIVELAKDAIWPTGEYAVEYTFYNNGSDTANCLFYITVKDVTPPIFIECPQDITVTVEEDCKAMVKIPTPTVGDNCGLRDFDSLYYVVTNPMGLIDTVHQVNASGEYPIGVSTIQYIAIDQAENTNKACLFKVIVKEAELPYLICPSDTLICQDSATVLFPEYPDECGNVILTNNLELEYGAASYFELDTTVVVFEAQFVTDTLTCSYNVVRAEKDFAFVSYPTDEINLAETFEPVSPIIDASEGWFTAAPSALPIDSTTGTIDVWQITQEGDYQIIYTTTGACYVQDTININVISGLYIPNGITPNGDGYNDIWKIAGLQQYPNSSVTIYNIWGNEVYHSANYQNNWDGSTMNQNLSKDGPSKSTTFYYHLKLSNGQEYNGYIDVKYE